MAAPGLLCQPQALAELATGARVGCQLLVVAPKGLTLEAVAAGEAPPLVPAHADALVQYQELVGVGVGGRGVGRGAGAGEFAVGVARRRRALGWGLENRTAP